MFHSKEVVIEKLTTIHEGWIIHNQKKVNRLVEQQDEEQKKLLNIAP